MNKNEELCLTVTTFNELLKAKFDEDPDLQNVYLRGELSNFRIYPSGHAYFSLKDDKSVVSAVDLCPTFKLPSKGWRRSHDPWLLQRLPSLWQISDIR